jgi:recombination protein RecA
MARPKKTDTSPVKGTDHIVEDAIKKISKDGTTFQRVGNMKNVLYPVLRTGLFAVDHHILGVGGFTRGRIVEVYGAPSGGKGTLTTQLIAQTQEDDEDAEVALIDAECAFDPTYANKLRAQTDRLLWAQPTVGEDALQATLDIISTGKIKLAIVDSIAALVPRAELEGEMSDAQMGLQARMMGKALRKLTGIVSKTKTVLIFINQTRDRLGVSFGDPTSTPGGKALKFFASTRLQIDRLSQIKEKDTNVGNVTKLAAKKNKAAAPFREATMNLYFDLPAFPDNPPGFDGVGSLVDLAVQHGIWKQDGAQYTLTSTGEIVKGKGNIVAALRDDLKIRRITEEATLTAMGKTPEYIKERLK